MARATIANEINRYISWPGQVLELINSLLLYQLPLYLVLNTQFIYIFLHRPVHIKLVS